MVIHFSEQMTHLTHVVSGTFVYVVFPTYSHISDGLQVDARDIEQGLEAPRWGVLL